jgi:pyruvate kinase
MNSRLSLFFYGVSFFPPSHAPPLWAPQVSKNTRGATETIALAAVEASLSLEAKAIVALTVSGDTARLLSKWHPKCPIFAVTREAFVARQVKTRSSEE